MSSKIIDLKQAVSLIWQTVELNKSEKGQAIVPYVFIVGAGISMPEITGANGIINHCKEVVENLYKDNQELLSVIKDMAEKYEERPDLYYSYWFEQAYRNKYHRQKYLEKIITEAKISSGNLLLAQILNTRKIATTVITPNFDDQLLQSLYLMGDYKVFAANNVLDNIALMTDTSQVQIVHVHGTYKFYDCCNLEREVLKVSQESGIKSTANAIDDFLKMHAPIVIGYSGWEQDVIMTRIRERLQYDLPFNMIWFCYTQEDYDSLPDWLKESSDVCFVMPVTKKDDKGETLKTIEKNYLPAKEVLSAIISMFKISLPSLLANPIDYILQLTQSILPDDESIFPLKTWKHRLDYMEEHITVVEKKVIEIEEAAAKKSIVDLTEKMESLDISLVPVEDLKHILFEVITPLIELKNRIESKYDVYKFCYVIIDIMIKRINDIDEEDVKKNLFSILYIVENGESDEQGIELLNKIIELTDLREEYDDIALMTLGVKSTCIPTEKRKAIQIEIINRGKEKIDDCKIARTVLIALFEKLFIERKVGDEEKGLIDIIFNKNINNETVISTYFYYILTFIEEGIEINENIDDIIERIKTCALEDREQILIRAYFIKGKLFNDNKQMLNLYENALENYKIDKYNKCSNCKAFVFMLYDIIDIKIEMNVHIERKYIDMIIDLSEKENKCNMIAEYIVITLWRYLEYIQSEVEKKELLKRCISICYENDMYADWDLYCSKYIECVDDVEKEIFLNENKKVEECLKADDLMTNAIEKYKDMQKEECLSQLLEAAEIYDNISENKYNPAILNIAYMIRRGEAPGLKSSPLDLLSVISWCKENIFLGINKYLCYWEDEMYEQAVNELKNMSIDSLNEALSWWTNEQIVGNEEKYCVLFGLAVTGYDISASINIYEKQFWQKCLKYIKVPIEYEKNIQKMMDADEIKKENIQAILISDSRLVSANDI